MNKKHPYQNRRWWRERLPWFIINFGIVEKGKDCKSVNAEHIWYNIDNKTSGCYFCKEIKEGIKWKK